MGTRSLTVIYDEDDKEICVLYRQYDGYFSAHGKELAEFLKDMKITNGVKITSELSGTKKSANGMNCLAAQIISHFKAESGGFYLHRAGIRDCWQDYIYEIKKTNKNSEEICLSGRSLYDDEYIAPCSPTEFLDKVEKLTKSD